jgi:hypothetical protein
LAESLGRIYDPSAMNLRKNALSTAALFAAAGMLGCSSGMEGVEKRLSSMQDEITRLQNQNDRLVERVDAMEVRGAKPGAPAKAPVAGHQERPSLKVVKVVPEDTAGMPSPQVEPPPPGEAADDPSPRPMIKVRGKSDAKGSDKGES